MILNQSAVEEQAKARVTVAHEGYLFLCEALPIEGQFQEHADFVNWLLSVRGAVMLCANILHAIGSADVQIVRGSCVLPDPNRQRVMMRSRQHLWVEFHAPQQQNWEDVILMDCRPPVGDPADCFYNIGRELGPAVYNAIDCYGKAQNIFRSPMVNALCRLALQRDAPPSALHEFAAWAGCQEQLRQFLSEKVEMQMGPPDEEEGFVDPLSFIPGRETRQPSMSRLN